MSIDINFMIGGEAGQGVQSVGQLLIKTFARGGFHVFADQDYESRIRGGHNFFRVRLKDSRVSAISDKVDFLVALNKETVDLHYRELAQNGLVIYDGNTNSDIEKKDNLFNVPMEKLAEETTGNKLMTNTVALGATLALVNYNRDIINGVLKDLFDKPEIAEANIKAVAAGYDYARHHYEGKVLDIRPVQNVKKMTINGNEAIALGAIAAGCKFMSAYPMTPASSIMEYMAAKSKEFGLVMVHAEDEIAAINMAVGAGYAGVRAMTATSGSGFCLMAEGLGMAGITETPVVIVDAQRPGPAVGLPTRTEQGDLQFVLHAHHGDFPRVVLAPGTIDEAFWLTVKAFNLAEKYQLPVIILTDHHLATSYETIEPFDFSKVIIERGELFQSNGEEARTYRRHAVTESGISPRALPGQTGALVVTDSDEHDETGHMTESAEVRTAQMQKRLRKMFSVRQEMNAPFTYGPKRADITLIGWGSTRGAIHEAMDIIRKDGASVNMLHLSELWPFPSEAVFDTIKKGRRSYVIESNATGQLASLIRSETGKQATGQILKFDGRPFTPAGIVAAVRKEEGYE